MKLFLVFLSILAFAQGTSFSLMNRCACSTYPTAVCDAIGYCSLVNNVCVDLQCSTVTQTNCAGPQTEYKCAWSTSKNVCESKTYTCSDFTTTEYCGTNYGFDCVWSTSTSKCVSFTCTGMDEKHCDFYRCSYVNGVCGSPQSVNCSTQASSSCGINRPGDGTGCALNDNKVCKAYNILPKSCSDYSDYKEYCDALCTYESSTKTCRTKQCSDYTTQSDCTFIANYYYFTFTPCYWNGLGCTEATDANIQTFDVGSCLAYTAVHYTWDFTAFKCVQCPSLSDYSLLSTMNGLLQPKAAANVTKTSSGNQILLAVVLSMLFLD